MVAVSILVANHYNRSCESGRFCIFGFAPSGEPLLLRSVVRTRFQFIVFALVAVEEQNLLRGLVLGLRHSVSLSEISGSIEPACWTRDAEASASSDASASCYGLSKDVGILAVVVAKLKLVQVQRQVFLAHVV